MVVGLLMYGESCPFRNLWIVKCLYIALQVFVLRLSSQDVMPVPQYQQTLLISRLQHNERD